MKHGGSPYNSTIQSKSVSRDDPVEIFADPALCVVMELVLSWMLTLLLVLLVLVSVVGNFLVCLAVKTDKTLRKLSNLFLVSLALADLFVRDSRKSD